MCVGQLGILLGDDPAPERLDALLRPSPQVQIAGLVDRKERRIPVTEQAEGPADALEYRQNLRDLSDAYGA